MYSIKSLHRLTTSTAHQTNLTKMVLIFYLLPWYHTNKCEISEVISLRLTFYFDRPKISAVASFSSSSPFYF